MKIASHKPTLGHIDREEIIYALRSQHHKDGVEKLDWSKVSDRLLILAAYTLVYAKDRGLPLVFTSIIRPQIPGVSKSKTHEQGRAFDISVRGWSDEVIKDFVEKINKEYKLGAVSRTTGEEREAVYEGPEYDQSGKQVKWPHLHIQCRP